MGWAMDPTAVATKDALEAMTEAFGVEPINKGEGGSIPFIPELQRIFPNAQVLVTGPEDPKANATRGLVQARVGKSDISVRRHYPVTFHRSRL